MTLSCLNSGVDSVLEWPCLGDERTDDILPKPVTSLSDRPRPFACKLFFCLNFSNHPALFALNWLSEIPTLIAKNFAFSRIIISVKATPCFRVFFAHTANARSISGNLPLERFTGDLLPSSGKRYFSFCLRTFETVLHKKLA